MRRGRPGWSGLASWIATRSDWLAVRVEQLEFAESDFLHSGFDFCSVANDDPDQIVGMHHGLCSSGDIRGLKRVNLRRHRVVVIVWQTEVHQLIDGTADGFLCFARTRKAERFIVLNGEQFFL